MRNNELELERIESFADIETKVETLDQALFKSYIRSMLSCSKKRSSLFSLGYECNLEWKLQSSLNLLSATCAQRGY